MNFKGFLTLFKTQVIVVLCCGLAPTVLAVPKSEYEMWTNFGNEITLGKHSLTSNSANSKNLDYWVVHYLNKQDVQAEKDWALILKDAVKDGTLHPVMKRALIRLNFSDSNPNNPRRSPSFAAIAMVNSCEKVLGKNNFLLERAYDFAGDICFHHKVFGKAAIIKRKQIALLEAKFGPTDKQTLPARFELCQYLINDQQFLAAAPVYCTLVKQTSAGRDNRTTKALIYFKSELSKHNALAK